QAASGHFPGIVESLRLVEGETRCDGWLEVAIDTGTWRRVPAELLLIRNFSNVCWELDCGGLDKSHVVSGQTYLRNMKRKEKTIITRVIEKIKRMTTELPEK
ncbi:SRCRM protein, partial [Zosterops hypoxanthus]|nr:SRCRM protein [Zosterops hypoxanthus]